MLSSRRKARTIEAFESDKRIVQAFAAAEQLVEAGELSLTELSAAKRRRHERHHQLQLAHNDADEAEGELRRLLGVSDAVRLVFAQEAVHGCAHTSMPPAYAAIDYVQHPRVRAAIERLEGGEAVLEAEIRRQYPELKVGPAYSREEGLDRFGLVAGITLPLWNRNRKGIAQAEGERDLKRADALALWRETVEGAAVLRRKLAGLLGHRAENALKSLAEADALVDAGELDQLTYIALREEILENKLNEAEWKTNICLVSEELEKYKVEKCR